MRFVAVFLVLCAAGASPQLVEQPDTKCEKVNQYDLEGRCPVSLDYSKFIDAQRRYSERISVKVWLKDGELHLSPKIRVLSEYKIYRPIRRRDRLTSENPNEEKVKCKGTFNQSYLVTIKYFKVEARRTFSVSYSTSSSNCSVSHKVADPQPEFSFSVDKQWKNVSVTVDSDDVVYVRLCYENAAGHCAGSSPLTALKSAVLSIPHMLVCVCVEVYYNYTDARRNKKALFPQERLIDVRDVWQTSKVELYESYITWSYECPADHLNVSASLCWKEHEHLCIPVLSSTLQKENGHDLKFNISTLDQHPQMCVQFSLQGSLNVSCLFQDDKSSWQASTESGRRSVAVHLKSTTAAKFSAQLCVLTEQGCAPRGSVHSVTLTKDAGDKRIYVPIHDITEKPCVQVWQSEPALKGRRIMCMDYTHKRWGLYPAAVFTFALLGCFVYRITKSGAAGLLIHRPLLLVSSSDRSAHVSAVCALASILQGELGAMVRTSLWAENSQKPAGNGAGVADLGPLPWLYGQWEAVCKAQGKILIVWSSEAKRTYERRKAERANADESESKKEDSEKANVKHERIREAVLEDFFKFNGKKLGKGKKQKSAKGKNPTELFEDNAWCSQKEASTVIKPVFMAALGALEGALQEGKGKEVAIVYFQGFCHRKDIPKAFRGVQSYCLPQDFSKLIQELAEVRGVTKIGEFRRRCWYRLLSKVKSKWLSRQLAQRLQAGLPQTQTHQASAKKMTSD